MALRIGHVGIRVPSLNHSVRHAEDVLGLREVTRIAGSSYLICNERHHALVLVESGSVALDHLAFEVAREENLGRLRAAIGREGVRILNETPQEPGTAQALGAHHHRRSFSLVASIWPPSEIGLSG